MRRIIRFKVGQELYIRNDLSDFKCWMVPGAKVSITAIRVTSNRDTQSIEIDMLSNISLFELFLALESMKRQEKTLSGKKI